MSKDLTDAQMLEALIQRNTADGWQPTPEMGIFINHGMTPANCHCVIFNHDFARALFGNAGMVLIETGEWITKKENDNHRNQWVIGSLSCFQYHLQQAVISDNPIKYMYEAVFGGNNA
jgi:hypothetical protein